MRGGDWTVSHNGHGGSVRDKLIELANVRIEQGDAAVGPIMKLANLGGIGIPGLKSRAKRAWFCPLAPGKICRILGQLAVNQNQSAQFGILRRASSLFDGSFNLVELFLTD